MIARKQRISASCGTRHHRLTYVELTRLVQARAKEVKVPAEDCAHLRELDPEREEWRARTATVRLRMLGSRVGVGKVDDEPVQDWRERLEAGGIEIAVKTLVSLVWKELFRTLALARSGSQRIQRTGRRSEAQPTKCSRSLLRNVESC